MSNGESELFEFDEDTKPYFVDYTLTDFIVKMINEKCITTAQIADLSNLEPNYINKLRIGQIKKPSRDKLFATCVRIIVYRRRNSTAITFGRTLCIVSEI